MTGPSEKAILNAALMAGSAEPDTVIWRNNTGQGWQGNRVRTQVGYKITIEPGMVVLRNARPITFGCPGSGDVLGTSGGAPIMGEAKTFEGSLEVSQIRMRDAWTKAGGAYILFRSPEEFVAGIRRAKEGK